MPYKFLDIQKKLYKLGYKIVRQKGSHVLFSNGKITFPVPRHGNKDISPGVEGVIIELIGISKEDFKKL